MSQIRSVKLSKDEINEEINYYSLSDSDESDDEDDSCYGDEDEEDLHDDRDYINNLEDVDVKSFSNDSEILKKLKYKFAAEILNYIRDQKIQKLKKAIDVCRHIRITKLNEIQRIWCVLSLNDDYYDVQNSMNEIEIKVK